MNTQVFTKIEQRTVEKEIYTRIREAIINGQVELGARLTESDLANQMNVSRIPIRESLRQLEQEGLVIRQPNRGCSVISFSEQDIKEVFTLRAMLESMAIEWAAPNLTSEDFKTLRRIIAEQNTVIKTTDYDALANLDMQFHEYICIKANHSRLLKSWYQHHAQCQILLNRRFRILADYTPETVIQDHKRILESIENNNPAAAIKLTHEISERVATECIKTLQNTVPA